MYYRSSTFRFTLLIFMVFVMVNDRTSRQLGSAPGLGTEIIAQIPEGTQFDVIGYESKTDRDNTYFLEPTQPTAVFQKVREFGRGPVPLGVWRPSHGTWRPGHNQIAVVDDMQLILYDDTFREVARYDMANLLPPTEVPTRSGIASAVWSPSGDTIALNIVSTDIYATSEFKVVLWDLLTNQPQSVISGLTNLSPLAWSPDGSKIALRDSTAIAPQKIRIMEALSGQMLSELETTPTDRFSWRPNGGDELLVGTDTTLDLWDVAAPNLIASFPRFDPAAPFDFSPDGSMMALASDNDIQIWNVDAAHIMTTLSGHTEAVTVLSWTEGGLHSISRDGTNRLWSVTAGLLNVNHSEVIVPQWNFEGSKLLVRTLAGLEIRDNTTNQVLSELKFLNHTLTDIVWSPNNQQIASADISGHLQIWDAVTGDRLHSLQSHQGAIDSIDWSAVTPNRLASGGSDGLVRIWDAGTSEPILTFSGHTGSITALKWSPSSNKLLSLDDSGLILVWDSISGEVITSITSDSIYGIDWSPDETKFVGGGNDGVATVWSSSTGLELLRLDGHTDAIQAVDWDSSGNRIATAGDTQDRTAKIWDANSGQLISTFTAHRSDISGIQNLKWSPNDALIATQSLEKVLIWQPEDGQIVQEIPEIFDYRQSLTWDMTGDEIALIADDKITVYSSHP